MSGPTWFFLVGLTVCGLIGNYSYSHGDYPWAAVSFATAAVLGFCALWEAAHK